MGALSNVSSRCVYAGVCEEGQHNVNLIENAFVVLVFHSYYDSRLTFILPKEE